MKICKHFYQLFQWYARINSCGLLHYIYVLTIRGWQVILLSNLQILFSFFVKTSFLEMLTKQQSLAISTISQKKKNAENKLTNKSNVSDTAATASSTPQTSLNIYSVFQGFRQAKSANGSILSTSQFLILPQLPQKIKLASKVVKVDSKIIISLPTI